MNRFMAKSRLVEINNQIDKLTKNVKTLDEINHNLRENRNKFNYDNSTILFGFSAAITETFMDNAEINKNDKMILKFNKQIAKLSKEKHDIIESIKQQENNDEFSL